MFSDEEGSKRLILYNRGSADVLVSDVQILNFPARVEQDSIPVSTPFTIAPGDEVELMLVMHSSEIGNFQDGQLTIASNDADTTEYRFSLSGYVMPPPLLTVACTTTVYSVDDDEDDGHADEGDEYRIVHEQGTIEFGRTLVGASLRVFCRARNQGEGTLTIGIPTGLSQIQIAPDTHQQVVTVNSGDYWSFSLTLPASAVGAVDEVLVLPTNTDEWSCHVQAAVVDGAIMILTPDAWGGTQEIRNGEHFDASSFQINEEINVEFHVHNEGSEDLLIEEVRVDEPFSIRKMSPPAVIHTGEHQRLVVRLSDPSEAGPYDANLDIVSNSINMIQFSIAIHLTVIGQPVLSVKDRSLNTHLTSGDTVDFGSTRLRKPSVHIFKVKNDGTADLNITRFDVSDGFFIDDDLGAGAGVLSIKPEEHVDVSVRLLAEQGGVITGDFIIENNDAPFSVHLLGEVILVPQITLAEAEGDVPLGRNGTLECEDDDSQDCYPEANFEDRIGYMSVGTRLDTQITLKNRGSAVLIVDYLSADGAVSVESLSNVREIVLIPCLQSVHYVAFLS